jgi:uncharacterized protein YjbI with pentapeptide repeats
LLLEEEIDRLLEANAYGIVALVGPAGSGKTTALQHVASVVPPAEDFLVLGGLPDVWQVILEQLAADESIPDARSALYRYLDAQRPDTDLVERSRTACLNALIAPEKNATDLVTRLAQTSSAPGLVRMLRHPSIQEMLATERVVADLHGDGACDYLSLRLPRQLVETVGRAVAQDEQALDHLRRLLEGPSWSHAMTASILHAAGIGWAPPTGLTALRGAYFPLARWPGVNLAGADLSKADLTGADLSGADLSKARLQWSVLVGAQLSGANLSEAIMTAADLTRADLTQSSGVWVKFDQANLEGANLAGASLKHAIFHGARLNRAVFTGANLEESQFGMAEIEGAYFSAANLETADLRKLPLRQTALRGANLCGAVVEDADLEGMDLSGVNFGGANLKGALLTGSLARDGIFIGARLSFAKLAFIDWEGADLRDAKLSDVSFYLGTARSGLLFTPIASEGTRTGFYTDDYDDKNYKPIEEIRKANLSGADLRGAWVTNTDFYLVDLRRASYDQPLAAYFRGCGAILEQPE